MKRAPKPGVAFSRIVRVMRRLRRPGGCPWDRRQTHSTLLKYLLEETREVARAVRRKDHANLREELGDVLLQILFHADIAEEAGRFDITAVIRGLEDKLVRRHPHVFARGRRETLTPAEVKRRWDAIKAQEKARP